MESGSSMPLAGFVILLLLLWLNGIFYGFSAAVHNLSENEVEKRAQEGDKKAVFLLSLINNPVSFVNAIPLIVMASGVCFGAFIVPWATETFHPYIKHLAALILVLALVIILLASLGILTFRRIGTYHPEKYAYRYMKIVGFFTRIRYPFTMCVTFIAKLAARPFGVAFNQSEDPVTEEEIIKLNQDTSEGLIRPTETLTTTAPPGASSDEIRKGVIKVEEARAAPVESAVPAEVESETQQDTQQSTRPAVPTRSKSRLSMFGRAKTERMPSNVTPYPGT